MMRIITPALAGISAARHLVWYFNYHLTGDARDRG